MSQSSRDGELTLIAGESLESAKYHIGQLDASGNAEIGESATDLIIGVIQNKPASGGNALIRFQGTSKVLSGGSVSIGDFITSDSSGHGVATTTDGDVVIGRALEAADSGDYFEVLLSLSRLYIA